MKLRTTRIPAGLTAVLLAGGLLLTGCSGGGTLQTQTADNADLTHAVTAGTGEALTTCGPFSLYLEEGMGVRVTDARTGIAWATNGRELDGSACSGEQFTLSYYMANAAYSEMNSFDDCVGKGQAEAYWEDGTLYVLYRLGDYNHTYADVPNTISAERFKEKFLSRLTPEEQENLKTYYKYYDSEGYWALRPKGRNNFEDILKIMEQVGYTTEDLAHDHGMYGIATETGARPQFTVTLAYTLTEEGLSVELPPERIAFPEEYPLYEIRLLPWFGREEQTGEGYVLLPDGSGALMRFADDHAGRTEVSLPIYGLDRSVASDTLQSGQYTYEQAALPVFGMEDGEAAYLAVIDGAPSKAILKAHPAGPYFGRNAAYVTFRMVNKDSVYLSGSDNSSKVIVFENGLCRETCRVRFCFLEAGSGYAGMAAFYRDMLLRDGALRPLESDGRVPLLLETVGGVEAKKNLLGISYEGLKAATAYTDNRTMAEDLRQNGVESLRLRLIGWFNGGVYHGYADGVSLNRVLGGRSGWDELRAYAAESGVELYPDVDFWKTAASSLSFLPATAAARRLDSSEVRYSILSRALLLEKNDIGMTPSSLYVVSPRRLDGETEKFWKDFSPMATSGLSLRSFGGELYSDFNSSDTLSRPQVQALVCEQLAKLSARSELMVETGFSYTWPYARRITSVATDCSHFRMADEPVPFLQMVLHGSAELYTSPINLASDAHTAVLKAVEYGVLLNYQVTYEDSDILKNSEYTDNYASGYTRWRDDILEAQALAQEVLSGLTGCAMVGYEKLSDTVSCTEYADGSRVYVNYGESAVQLGTVTVPARGCCRERGNEQ